MDTEEEQRREHNQFEGLIQGLIDHKYGYSDDFFDAHTVAGLRNNIKLLSDLEEMQVAGFGNKKEFQKGEQFRGDKIKWIERSSKDRYESIFLKKIEHFAKHLNKTCYTSIKTFESHYASYGKGHFYKKHKDQFKKDKGRQFSVVLYLNEDWQPGDEGMLSLYPEGEEQRDVLPIGGRMVFFRSDEMEHEVHPSFTRDRVSIAGWLKN